MRSICALAGLLILLPGVPVMAATVVVGTANDTNCYPLTCSASLGTGLANYQQVYSANKFSGPIAISAVTFFDQYALSSGQNGGPVISGDYTVSLSTTQSLVNALSTSFNDNVGSDSQVIFRGDLAQPVPGSFSITTMTPFYYDPANGNLLLAISAVNQADVPDTGNPSPGYNGFLDADRSGVDTSRLYQTAFGISADSIGLVTGFSGVPEPGTLGLGAVFGAGLAALSIISRKARSEAK